MAVTLAGFAPGSSAVDEELAKELKSVLLQQRQLTRDAREYRLSIQMLETHPETANENALNALRNQLARAIDQMAVLDDRRAALEKTLGLDDQDAGNALANSGAPRSGIRAQPRIAGDVEPGATRDGRTEKPVATNSGKTPREQPPAPDSAAEAARLTALLSGTAMPEAAASRGAGAPETAGTSASAETSRLTALLSGAYGGESDPGSPAAERTSTGAKTPQIGVDAEKIRLNGAEGLLVIDRISDRLARGPQSISRESDIVFHVEVRRDGKLVSSTSHSLRSLGKSQYVSKVALGSGRAKITVRRDDWIVNLEDAGETEYLVTLDMPAYGDSSLHIIPVEELRDAGIENPPAWLPYLGSAHPESS